MDETNSFEWMRRDKWHIPKFHEFQTAMEKSKKECVDLTKMSELVLTLGCTLIAFLKVPSFFENDRYISERYSQSLVFTCFIEFLRSSVCTVFLCGCGLYKNAYHNIRYALESIIQSSYLDSSHPNSNFLTKIEILKEVEDLPEYRGVQLVKKLDIAYKKETRKGLIKEYRKLSKRVHSTHRQFVATASNFMERSYSSVYVDCSEVSNIYDSMKILYNIFFLLFLTHFPELRKPLKENNEFVETVKSHNLTLLLKVLRI